jgi:ABC-type Zn uptake system ZnuABC Zn-binding protein ZnuA
MHTLIPPVRVLIAALLALAFAACGPAGCGRAEPEDRPARVIVSIPPLMGLLQPMFPEGTEFTVLVESGRSVHGYEPTPAHMATLARADVVVVVGLGLEGRLVDAVRHGGANATLIEMSGVLGIEGHGHVHHEGHDHGADEPCGLVDAHLWLDPVLVREFIETLPAHLPEKFRDTAGAAAPGMAARINEVHEAYRDRLAPFAGRAIITHHASMSRPAERYGVRVAGVLRPIETIESSAADIAAARRAIDEEGIGAVFVEPQFSKSSAERLAESAGVRTLVLDPLGDGDWFAMMRTNLERLVEGLGTPRNPAP